jgi:ATP-dependent Clp protease adapter protein ClpS
VEFVGLSPQTIGDSVKSISALVLASILAQPAFATSVKEVIQIASSPMCFTRDYSQDHLAQHPKQTVRSMKAKVYVHNDQYTKDMVVLAISAKLKGDTERTYRQAMSCMENEGRVNCFVDCDGGSVDIAEITKDGVKLKNNGVVVRGGCGSDEGEITRFLEDTPRGDDVFTLKRSPIESCKRVETNAL